MRNNMQRIKELAAMLDTIKDEDTKDLIQEELWMLEEEMEYCDDEEYKSRHFNKSHDVFQ